MKARWDEGKAKVQQFEWCSQLIKKGALKSPFFNFSFLDCLEELQHVLICLRGERQRC